MRFLSSLALVALLTLSGCLDGGTVDDADSEAVQSTITRVQDRAGLDFVTNATEHPYSLVLEAGAYEILDGVGKVITVDMPLGTGLPTADVHMGLFFPDIPGCDWGAESLPEECRLPVVADVGPYWGEAALGDVHAEDRGSGRLGEFLIENLVPHGYVIAQVSVTGTGDSTGCMDLMGPVEQAGVQEAVRHLGQAPWSNGNVGLIGRSYDGSTPWEAAMAADLPELKTVVPISGLYGQLDLMWRNGSVEFRGPGVLWGLYYAFTYTGNDPVTGGDHFDPQLLARQLVENSLCADTQTGAAQAAAAYVYGGDPTGALEGGSYWAERSFKDEVLANYEGSVYFIHGMQDWNVDPHMAFPFYGELQAKGLDIKGLFGQWGHNYPDRVSEHPDNLRWDWAQDLKEWFDHYLKETGDQPQLHVEIEDDRHQWRTEDTWPPADAAFRSVGMDEMTQSAGQGTRVYGAYDPVTQSHVGPNNVLRFDLGALSQAEETRIAGQPLFHVTVTPDGPGGMVYAELRDKTTDRRLGHAIMDLRYHEGGTEMQVVTPMTPIVAKMEFFPLDVLVPAGHELELVVANGGRDYLPPAVDTPVTVHADGDSVLRLPVIERDGSSYFTPPGWE